MREHDPHREHLRRTETEIEVLRAFAGTFLNRWDCYPLQQPSDGKYVCVKSALTVEILDQHLR